MNFQKDLVEELLDMFICEVSKPDTKNRIATHIIEPSFSMIFDRLYPYIIITCVIFVLIFLMAITIIFILIRK